MIRKLIKLLVFLSIIGFIGLVIFAYAAPWLKVDFAPPRHEIRLPVTLEGQE